MTIAERFAAHVIGTQFSDLSPQGREHAAVYILDSVGAGIAGSSVAGSEHLLRVASGWRAPTTTVWGRNVRLSAPAAAFLNAWQIHNQEFDCLHGGAVKHAMASVFPAASAAVQLSGGISGTELLIAIAIGADVAAGLGLASLPGFRLFRPATAGWVGAVAVAGRILGAQ